MATLELCDLCGGKVIKEFVNLTIDGKVENYLGDLPEPPKGFKYTPDETPGQRLLKVWDSYGNVVSETKFVSKPEKWKRIRVNYDLCEICAPKLISMLEMLRSKYHLEKKSIELLEPDYTNPFHGLLD